MDQSHLETGAANDIEYTEPPAVIEYRATSSRLLPPRSFGSLGDALDFADKKVDADDDRDESVQTRILLFQWNGDVDSDVACLPSSFLLAHLKESISHLPVGSRKKDWLLAKWSSLESQPDRSRCWHMDREIYSGKPYDAVQNMDPRHNRRDHIRYNRLSKVYRSYNRISTQNLHEFAAKQCISLYTCSNAGTPTTIVVFDPPRRLERTKIEFGAWSGNETLRSIDTQLVFPNGFTGRQRFASILTTHMVAIGWHSSTRDSESSAHSPELDWSSHIRNTILEIVTEDSSAVLAALSASLDAIEISSAIDGIPKGALANFRDFFGCWRNQLFHQLECLTYLKKAFASDVYDCWSPTQLIQDLPDIMIGGRADHNDNAPTPSPNERLADLDDVLEHNQTMQRRLEGAYQTLMSTMSIVESARAIDEAEQMSKLTSAALFFIPLNLVAGLFSMSLKAEFDGKLTLVLWASVSLGLTVATYAVLYRMQLYSFICRVPKLPARLATAYGCAIRSMTTGLRQPTLSENLKAASSMTSGSAEEGVQGGRPPKAAKDTTSTVPQLRRSCLSPISSLTQQRHTRRGILGIVVILCFLACSLAGLGVGIWRVCVIKVGFLNSALSKILVIGAMVVIYAMLLPCILLFIPSYRAQFDVILAKRRRDTGTGSFYGERMTGIGLFLRG